MKLVTSAQMRAIDGRAINELGIPGIDLMENAGRGIAQWIRELFDGDVNGRRFGIVCGKGNNGGDGYVIARYLLSWGAVPEVFMLTGPDDIKGDALTNLHRIQALELPILRLSDDSQTWIPAFAGMTVQGGAKVIGGESAGMTQTGSAGRTTQKIGLTGTSAKVTLETRRQIFSGFDMIVDAIFGTGFSGKIDSRTAETIDQINKSGVKVVAVDTPSGLNSDTGEQPESCVRASYTATLALPKIGQFFYPGRNYCGEIKVIDIGIPDSVAESFNLKLNLTTEQFVKASLPDRAPTIHKGDAGKLFILAGSVGLTGAATLAANAAMKSGAGLVTVGCPKSLNDILEIKLTEAMTRPLPEIKSKRCLSIRSLGDILQASNSADAVALGPGVGRHHETIELFRRLIQRIEKPCVLDADGLYPFSGKPELLKSCQVDLVLTPHIGEFSRLTAKDIDLIKQDIISSVLEFASRVGKCVLLKGAPTIIGAPDGSAFVNPTGNAGMATGGSGDVLSGIIGAFLAAGLSAYDSAICGAYVHGLAGDLARPQTGVYGMIATDILNNIPAAIRALKG